MDKATARFNVKELDRLTVGEAFLKYVIHHPSVGKYQVALTAEDKKWTGLFEGGRLPGASPHPYRWPCSPSSVWLASQSLQTPKSLARKLYPAPGWPVVVIRQTFSDEELLSKLEVSEDVRGASRTLADRVRLFFGCLSRDEIIAVDMAGKEVGKAAWLRSTAKIDIRNSDLCEGADERPLRRGLTVKLSLAGTGSVKRVESGVPNVSASAPNNKAGRENHYDWANLKEKLVERVKTSGPFKSRSEFLAWGVENTTLLPGRPRPKRTRERPDRKRVHGPNRKTVKEAFDTHEFWRIGLIDGGHRTGEMNFPCP